MLQGNYRPRSEGDNALGRVRTSVRPSVRPCVCLFVCNQGAYVDKLADEVDRLLILW